MQRIRPALSASRKSAPPRTADCAAMPVPIAAPTRKCRRSPVGTASSLRSRDSVLFTSLSSILSGIGRRAAMRVVPQMADALFALQRGLEEDRLYRRGHERHVVMVTHADRDAVARRSSATWRSPTTDVQVASEHDPVLVAVVIMRVDRGRLRIVDRIADASFGLSWLATRKMPQPATSSPQVPDRRTICARGEHALSFHASMVRIEELVFLQHHRSAREHQLDRAEGHQHPFARLAPPAACVRAVRELDDLERSQFAPGRRGLISVENGHERPRWFSMRGWGGGDGRSGMVAGIVATFKVAKSARLGKSV